MFKFKFENLKKLIAKKTDGDNKKNIENLAVFLVLLVITIIAINTIWGTDKKEEETNKTEYRQLAESAEKNINSNIPEEETYNLESKLKDILSKISGAGEVEVLITYSETSRIVAMYNESQNSSSTEETDTNGGKRNIQETDTKKEIVLEQKNGESVPVTEKVVMPKVEGAIILAEGAGNIEVKTNIIQAVSAVTGLASYKVQVFELTH